MICSLCSAAGEMAKAYRDMDPKYVTGAQGYRGRDIKSLVFFFHNTCKGCDCQHKIDFEGVTIQSLKCNPQELGSTLG